MKRLSQRHRLQRLLGRLSTATDAELELVSIVIDVIESVGVKDYAVYLSAIASRVAGSLPWLVPNVENRLAQMAVQ